MKSPIKVIAGIILAIVVVGTLAVLAIKYFDILLRVFDNVKSKFAEKKFGLFSKNCCDFDDDDDLDDALEV